MDAAEFKMETRELGTEIPIQTIPLECHIIGEIKIEIEKNFIDMLRKKLDLHFYKEGCEYEVKIYRKTGDGYKEETSVVNRVFTIKNNKIELS